MMKTGDDEFMYSPVFVRIPSGTYIPHSGRGLIDPDIAEAAVASCTPVIIIGEHQTHRTALVIQPYRNQIMNLTAVTRIGFIVQNSPVLRAVQLEDPVSIERIRIFIKADALDLTLYVALEVKLDNCIYSDDESLIRLTPGIIGQDQRRTSIRHRKID